MANTIIGRVLIHDAQQPDETNRTVLSGHWSAPLTKTKATGVTGVRRIVRQEIDSKGEGATYSAADFDLDF